ncbi:MAG: Rieske (2Fe-2S) protein [Gemmatimonadota bacterium]
MSEANEIRLPTTSASVCGGCDGCPDRRSFLRIGAGSLALALLAGAVPRRAAAAVARSVRATAAGEVLRYPLPAGDGVEVDRDNEVILARYHELVAAFALSCPHQRSLLRWREDDGIFQCTKHRSKYSPTGEFIDGRATRNMDRLAIRLEGGEVVVDPSVAYHSDDDPEGWASAVVTVP